MQQILPLFLFDSEASINSNTMQTGKNDGYSCASTSLSRPVVELATCKIHSKVGRSIHHTETALLFIEASQAYPDSQLVDEFWFNVQKGHADLKTNNKLTAVLAMNQKAILNIGS